MRLNMQFTQYKYACRIDNSFVVMQCKCSRVSATLRFFLATVLCEKKNEQCFWFYNNNNNNNNKLDALFLGLIYNAAIFGYNDTISRYFSRGRFGGVLCFEKTVKPFPYFLHVSLFKSMSFFNKPTYAYDFTLSGKTF